MKKIISLIIILFSIFIGCEKDSKIEEVKNSYIIGIDDADYPFEYRDPITGKLTGFEYELISEIAKEGDFEIKIIIIPFANLIPELAKNAIDIGIGHFSITDERKKLVNFSNSYLSSNEVVLANKNNTSTNEDAPIYAEPPGTTFLDYAKKIPNAKIVEEVKYDKIIEKLLQKEIDYTIIDEPTATVYSSMHSELYIKENIQRTYIGLALSKKLSKEDTKKINKIIDKFIEDGTIDKLKEKYNIR